MSSFFRHKGGKKIRMSWQRVEPPAYSPPVKLVSKKISRFTDPGCLSRLPDPHFFHPGSRVIKIPNQRIQVFLRKKLFLISRKYDLGCSSRIRILLFTHSGSLIADPVVEKAPDPGSLTLKKLPHWYSTSLVIWGLFLLLPIRYSRWAARRLGKIVTNCLIKLALEQCCSFSILIARYWRGILFTTSLT